MKRINAFLIFVVLMLLLPACHDLRSESVLNGSDNSQIPETSQSVSAETVNSHTSSDDLFSGNSDAFCIVNNNIPFFFECEMTAQTYQSYSDLDSLGRCGTAVAVIGKETMPNEERGKIGSIKPSGWHTVKYNDIIEGNYLYNRCHLIGYQLSGENANPLNLITGTRFLNVNGMLPFENMVSDYLTRSGNHVLYRVTPKFDKFNLLADGVLIEAKSVEDGGTGLQFCVFCYNIQPGITIDYATGESKIYDGTPLINGDPQTSTDNTEETKDYSSNALQTRTVENVSRDYILNTGTKRFHLPDCESVADIKDKNKKAFTGTREDLIQNGYSPCQRCDP
ncbi:MAG: DNA/RNA non-specific endonuclease [Ruminococcus sp.]|nr:DNA/RNA non-specific endonuclease [Ruminococcus sp.]